MEELIYRYLSGEASENEVKKVFTWLEESESNRKEMVHYKKIWALSTMSNEDEQKAWKEVEPQIYGSRQKKTILMTLLKYAAIATLLLGVGAASQYFLNKREQEDIYADNTSFKVPTGQISSVVLPDGTLVYLNSESKLLYGNDFAKGYRTVELDGEAYFDVKTDSDHPFVVKTPGKVHVKVHGTEFNLRAYKNGKSIQTTLEEGRVSIIDSKGKELAQLVPGELATYTKLENKIKINKVRTELYSSWKDGMITFGNESLREIARMMERWYNVKIEFENPEIADELYNGTIMKNKPIDQILEVFRITSSLKYEIIPQLNKPTLIRWSKKEN